MKEVVTKQQRQKVYSINEEPINMYRLNTANHLDLELKTFTDDKGVEHRYLISKDATEKGSCTFFCGGSDLNMGKANYIDFMTDHKDKGFGLIVPIYPGFHEGLATNKTQNATEENINASVAAIYEHVKKEDKVDPSKMNILGYSLGGPIAAKLVAENKELNNLTMISPPSSVLQASIDALNPKGNKLKAWVIDKSKGLLGEKYDTVSYLSDISSQSDRDVKTTMIMDSREDFAKQKGKDGKTHFDRLEEVLRKDHSKGNICSKANYVTADKIEPGKDPHQLIITTTAVAANVSRVRGELDKQNTQERQIEREPILEKSKDWRKSVTESKARDSSPQVHNR